MEQVSAVMYGERLIIGIAKYVGSFIINPLDSPHICLRDFQYVQCFVKYHRDTLCNLSLILAGLKVQLMLAH